jgi:hypothetical protein
MRRSRKETGKKPKRSREEAEKKPERTKFKKKLKLPV